MLVSHALPNWVYAIHSDSELQTGGPGRARISVQGRSQYDQNRHGTAALTAET